VKPFCICITGADLTGALYSFLFTLSSFPGFFIDFI
jgi:hypothetical protein